MIPTVEPESPVQVSMAESHAALPHVPEQSAEVESVHGYLSPVVSAINHSVFASAPVATTAQEYQPYTSTDNSWVPLHDAVGHVVGWIPRDLQRHPISMHGEEGRPLVLSGMLTTVSLELYHYCI